MSSCFSRCLRVPIAIPAFYESYLWILQALLLTHPDLHPGLLVVRPRLREEGKSLALFAHEGARVNLLNVFSGRRRLLASTLTLQSENLGTGDCFYRRVLAKRLSRRGGEGDFAVLFALPHRRIVTNLLSGQPHYFAVAPNVERQSKTRVFIDDLFDSLFKCDLSAFFQR